MSTRTVVSSMLSSDPSSSSAKMGSYINASAFSTVFYVVSTSSSSTPLPPLSTQSSSGGKIGSFKHASASSTDTVVEIDSNSSSTSSSTGKACCGHGIAPAVTPGKGR